MGQIVKGWCGGSLLLWSVFATAYLMNVALHANGFPLNGNESRSLDVVVDDDDIAYISSTPDDLALSSEEDDDAYSLLTGESPPLDSTASQQGISLSESSDLELSTQNNNNNNPPVSAHSQYEKEDGVKGKVDETPTFSGSSASSPHVHMSAKRQRHRRKVEKAAADEVKLIGLSIDYDSDKRRVDYDSRGSPNIVEGTEVKLTLYGRFTNETYFQFTKFHKCHDPNNPEREYKIRIIDEDMTVGIVDVKLPEAGELNEVYMCLRPSTSLSPKRQGESKSGDEFGNPISPWLIIKLTKSMFPFYIHVLLIVGLLVLSGLFSGLNLGLMSLDKTDLKIIMNTGSKSEKNYASSIAPVRNHGNFLLCCLLFSNVLVNATLTILVDDLTSGLIAIAGSTLAIVIFGEIIPQAICSRYGLAVGARTIYVTKFFMFLTAPLAFPLSIILDRLLGEEIGNIYNRERLKELLKVTKDHHGLETEEVGIISGALDLRLKTVKDVMISSEQIFMLPADTMLDFETMAEIEYQGYSRIPVYDGDRSNVVALINVRQLTLLDASDNIPLRTIMDYYKTNLFFVFENTRLDYMFKAFREGSRGHMAFVQRVNDDGPGDPYYETVGMLTMEDVLEEILQADIRDENDVGKVNARSGNTKRPPTVPFVAQKKPRKFVDIPATLGLAATQFLSTSVPPFKDGTVSVTIIQRLLKSNVHFIKCPKKKARQQSQDVFLYENGKSADAFVMILEGRVQVKVGKEKLMYEAGPFSAFGNDFLMNDQMGATSRTTIVVESTLNSPTEIDVSERPSITSEVTELKRRPTFVPDYDVKLLSDVYYFQMKYDHYRHALAATDLEKAYSSDPEKSAANAEWQYEIDKVLDTGEDEEEAKEDLKAGGDNEIKKDVSNLVSNTENPTDKDTSTTSTESDESDNKDSDHDENHPTEETKLLYSDTAYS